MYPDGDNDDKSNRTHSDDDNPFIAFRHLVDKQISTALQILSREAGDTTKDQAPEDIHSRLFGIFGQPPLHDRTMSRDDYYRYVAGGGGEQEVQRWIEQQRQGQRHHDGDNNDDNNDNHHHHHNHLDHMDSMWPSLGGGGGIFRSGPAQESSYDAWRLLSPYSPEYLVNDRSLPARMRQHWHAAFNDLLALHNGEQLETSTADRSRHLLPPTQFHEARRRFLESRDLRGAHWYSSPFGDHHDDLLALVAAWDHHPHPNQPRLGQAVGDDHTTQARRRKEQEENMEVLEEDMYRHFLDIQGGRGGGGSSGEAQQRSPSKIPQATDRSADDWSLEKDPDRHRTESAGRSSRIEEAASKSEIVSSVTQSYTTIDADGSTRTVRRFKKTFADGREECNEDISEEPAPVSRPEVTETKKRSGWFWS